MKTVKPSTRTLGWLATAVFGLGSASALAQEGSAEAGEGKSLTCGACHGTDGNSVNPIWPSLASQHAVYIVRQMEAYRDQERNDAGMQGFASTLSEQDVLDIASYYAEQAISAKGADPAVVGLGEQIYRGGIPEREVPACIACHGPEGNGNELAGYPKVSHQHATYMSTTLRAYRSGDRRSDTELNQMMRNVAELLLDDEIEALASYMQGLN